MNIFPKLILALYYSKLSMNRIVRYVNGQMYLKLLLKTALVCLVLPHLMGVKPRHLSSCSSHLSK